MSELSVVEAWGHDESSVDARPVGQSSVGAPAHGQASVAARPADDQVIRDASGHDEASADAPAREAPIGDWRAPDQPAAPTEPGRSTAPVASAAPGTGNARVDAALDELVSITSRPLAEQVDGFVSIHRALSETLAALDDGR